jgi:hypothetical protein
LHRSDSDFESIPGQRGLGTRQHGERVREVTEWALPRVGPFFAGRDDTTVLHSVRRMEDRAARDLELLAYMASIKRVRPVGGLPSPSKTWAPQAGEVVLSRVASAAVPRMFRLACRRESLSAGPLAAAWRRAPRHGPNFLFAPSALSLRVRSEGEGNGYRWRRSRRQGCVAGSRAFRAPLQRDRLAVGGRGRGEDKPKAIEPSSCAQNARSGHDRTRP